MATIKQITIEYGYTFNLGNYNSIRPAVTLTADLVEGENVETVTRALQDQARTPVETEIDAALKLQGRAPYFEQLRNNARLPINDEVPF
jgi:hypothetical protein